MWSSRRVKSSACGILEIEFDQVTSRQEELWRCWRWNEHNNDMRTTQSPLTGVQAEGSRSGLRIDGVSRWHKRYEFAFPVIVLGLGLGPSVTGG